jgi:glycosyltransferase involved in cell wall biosynthesis
MTKLIIQIPCLNESETIAGTIADLPTAIEGVDEIEILVIDDGSEDDTVEAARAAGAHHVVSNGVNRGLAQSFQRGLDACLRRGADIIVNTDGDNQYNGADVSALVKPILEGRADVVVGDRQTETIAHFSPLKKKLQRAGSDLVSVLAKAEIADAVSGFRAFSREAAMGLTVRSSFSYTTETLIQAGRRRLRIASVPIRTNKVERPSRLFRSIPQFLLRTGRTMLRAYAMYEPLKVFAIAGLVLMALGAVPVRITAPELYDALARGTVDGMVFPTASALAYDVAGLAKSVTRGENFGTAVLSVMISEERWQRLPENVRAVMTRAGEETTRHICRFADESTASDFEEIAAQGTAIADLSADKADIRRKSASVAETWVVDMDKRGLAGARTFEAFQEALR